jgi:branched-chain amino acid aminotransferase
MDAMTHETTMFPITATTTHKPRPDDDTLQFGRVFTDHMFMMDYDEGKGWHSGRIVPYAPFSMDPACCVLHYAQAVFDGLKAFRGRDDQVRLFRVDQHAARLNRSCEQLCIPPLDQQVVEDSIAAIVDARPSSRPRPSSASTRRTATYTT